MLPDFTGQKKSYCRRGELTVGIKTYYKKTCGKDKSGETSAAMPIYGTADFKIERPFPAITGNGRFDRVDATPKSSF